MKKVQSTAQDPLATLGLDLFESTRVSKNGGKMRIQTLINPLNLGVRINRPCWIKACGGFQKWGLPLVIIHFCFRLSSVKHPAIAKILGYPHMWKAHESTMFGAHELFTNTHSLAWWWCGDLKSDQWQKKWGAFQFGIWILIFSERSSTGIIFTSCLITSSSIWVNYNDLTTTSLESCFFLRDVIPKWP